MAREKARELRYRIQFEGYDPIAGKRAAKSALIAERAKERTFGDVAQQYFDKKCLEFSGKNPEKQRRRLEQHLEDYCLPELGNILMSDLEPRHVFQALNPIWMEKTSTAERVRITIYNVCEMVRHDGVLRNGAYSRPRLPLIPDEACHPFHAKAATDSTAKLPPWQAA
jgi:hypothetical protein